MLGVTRHHIQYYWHLPPVQRKESFVPQLQNHWVSLRNILVCQDAACFSHWHLIITHHSWLSLQVLIHLKMLSSTIITVFNTFFLNCDKQNTILCSVLQQNCLHSYFWPMSACSPSQFSLQILPHKTNLDNLILFFFISHLLDLY